MGRKPHFAGIDVEQAGDFRVIVIGRSSLGKSVAEKGNQGEQIGPRFDDLVLNGVLYNPAVGSVATMTDQKTGKRYRAREGDRLGEIRIAAIRAQEVDFVITSFGISRRETLRVERDKEIEG